MKIESLADLEQLLKLCHKQKVHAMKIDGIEFALSPVDPDAPKVDSRLNDPLARVESILDGMTEEDIAMWHANQA